MAQNLKVRILVVDDEENITDVIESVLTSLNYSVSAVNDPIEAQKLIQEENFDLVMTDLNMDPVDGFGILRTAQSKDKNLPVVFITASSDAETAVDAMRSGAYDYVLKPFKIAELKIIVARALDYRAKVVENIQLKNLIQDKYDFDNIVGSSNEMNKVFAKLKKVAPTNATVLVNGESGTGKELVAKAIFANSNRKDAPFISINCGAMTETLLESELFGYKKGAFTGAQSDHIGLFQAADGGTIFLDEIGLTSTALQMRLLRVLQEQEVRRVGDTRDIKVDVRVIAATNEDLEEKVRLGEFREDLFYRLSVIPVIIPPLRERRTDIPALVEHFISKSAVRSGGKYRFDKEFLDRLLVYNWPGNVRELENIIERCIALADEDLLQVENLPNSILFYEGPRDYSTSQTIKMVVADAETRHIKRVLLETGSDKKETAKVLGIDLATLYRKLERYGMK